MQFLGCRWYSGIPRGLLFLLIWNPFTNLLAEPLKVDLKSEAAILINAENGAILYEKNGRKLYCPASTTKVATALYALKLKGNRLSEMVTANQEDLATMTEEEKRKINYTMPPHWLVVDGTHIGLKKGEIMSFQDLLYGMMLESGNDASNVIARFVSGSIPAFMSQLNAYLKDIGCYNTLFTNPHGLFHPKHQSTAYDMALMTKEALKNPTFCQIVATHRYPRPLTNKQTQLSVFVQHNKLLKQGAYYYSKAIGVKTGYHSKAQHTLIAAAKQDQRILVAVLLKAKEKGDVYKDAIQLFEAAFNEKQIDKVLLQAGTQSFEWKSEGTNGPVNTYLKEDLKITYYPAEEPFYKSYLFWDQLAPPVKKDQKVGNIKVIHQKTGETLATALLFSQNAVELSWKGWFSRHLVTVLLVMCCCIGIISIYGVRRLL